MKYDCAVIKDLLPLYADNAVSPRTREIIEEHLRGCESCSDFLATIRKSSRRKATESLPPESQAMRNIAKMMRRRRIRTVAVIVSIIALAIVLWMILGNHYSISTVWTSDMKIIDREQALQECSVIEISESEYELTRILLDEAFAEAGENGKADYRNFDDSYLQNLMKELDIDGEAHIGSYHPHLDMAQFLYSGTRYQCTLYFYTNGNIEKTVKPHSSGELGMLQRSHIYYNLNNEHYEKHTQYIDIWRTIKANLGID